MRVRTFKNKEILNQMLALRQVGLTLETLANIFDCDFSTIYHHCTQYNIRPTHTLWITPNLVGKIAQKRVLYIEFPEYEDKWYINGLGEKINKGKNYKDYIKS